MIKRQLKNGDQGERLNAIKTLRNCPHKGAVRVVIPVLADEDERVRSAALSALIEIGERDVQALLSSMGSRWWLIRSGVSHALIRWADGLIDDLVKRLSNSNKDVVYWAMKVLAASRNKEGLEALIGCLHNSSPEIREYAADFLGQSRDVSVFSPLIKVLTDPCWKVRRTAASSLASFGNAVVPAVSRAILEQPAGERYWLLKILEKNADSRALSALVNVLESPAPEERRLALSSLRQLKEKGIIPALVRCLGDELWTIRKESAETLLELGPEVASALIPLLKHDNAHSRCWACKVLGEIGDVQVSGEVATLLRDKEWYVRCAAAYSLGQLRSSYSVESLMDALEDPSEEVRKSVAIALGNMSDSRAVPALQDALGDENEWVRKYAEESLRKIRAA